jgi:hypothetical protein
VTELDSMAVPTECYPFSALLIPLPPVITQVLRALARAIPDEQLTGRGRELYPHVTILDTLHAECPDPWRWEVERERPFVLRLGETSAFLAAHTGQDHDVLKVDLTSEALMRLHDRLAARLPHAPTSVSYLPHATVAFLKPGCAAPYTGQSWLAGWSVVVEHLHFSSRTHQVQEIPLRGQRRAKLAGRIMSPGGDYPPVVA